jgi:hypothetical protein
MSNTQLNSTNKSWDIIASRVYSGINANLTLEASGNANLQIKTNGNILVSADPIGNITFTNPPICSVLPFINSQFVNKQYADSLVGPQGAQGAQGSQGAQGTLGAQGTQGSQGLQGTIGDQGLAGQNGSQGSQGTIGAQGSQGAEGTQGSIGNQGFAGADGTAGTTGGKGATGGQGSQGPQGFQGSQGIIGSQGITGSIGATGGPSNFTTSLTPYNNLKFSYNSSTNTETISLYPPLYLDSINTSSYTNTGAVNLASNSTGSQLFFTNGTTGTMYYNISSTFTLTKPLSIVLQGPNTFPDPSNNYVARGTTGGIPLYCLASSIQYKTNIERLLDNYEILNVQPVYFNYKDTNENPIEPKRIGFIAEDMAKNELGNYFVPRNEDNLCETIDYDLLAPLYASALRLLKTNINNFENDLLAYKIDQTNMCISYRDRINKLQIWVKNKTS